MRTARFKDPLITTGRDAEELASMSGSWGDLIADEGGSVCFYRDEISCDCPVLFDSGAGRSRQSESTRWIIRKVRTTNETAKC